MFEIDHSFVTRGQAMHSDPILVYGTAISDFWMALVCIMIGTMTLVWRVKRNYTTIYLPLGMFFITLGAVHVSLLICIWVPLYWMNLIIKLVAVFFAIWVLIKLPTAMKERRAMSKVVQKVQEKAETIEKLKDEVTNDNIQ